MQIEKHILHEIFGFSGIAQDFDSNAQNQAVIAVEQHRERLIVEKAEVSHQIIVVEPVELAQR
jgi:hypothetical protein